MSRVGFSLNILQASPYYPPHRGGLEMVAYHIVWGMRQRGYRVNVVTTNTGENMDGFSNHDDTHRVPVDFKIYNTPVSLKAYNLLDSLAENADLIHTYAYPVYFSDISAVVASKKRVPLLLHWVVDPRQALIYTRSRIAKGVTDFYFKVYGNSVFQRSSMIVVPSEAYKLYLIEHGVPEEKIKILLCGIDTELFNSNASRKASATGAGPKVLFVGRINDQKGFDILLKAFPKILQKHPETELVVVGLPDQDYFWKSVQNSLKTIKNHVRLLGNISRKQLAEWYAKADILAFPSRYESFGIVAIEALGSGTPVVGTSVGAVGDLIKQFGILVKKDDAEGLANAINLLLSDAQLRKDLGQRAAKLVSKEYSWEKILDQCEYLYQNCIQS